MNDLLRSHFTWTQFFVAAVGLFALYFALQFGKQILKNTQFLGSLRLPLLKSVERLLIFYEPIVILLLGSAFVLIRPSFHGLWMVLLLIGGFSHVKNYISGIILQMDKGLSIGNQIKVGEHKGMIATIDRLGIQLNTAKGTQYINYSTLSDKGYLLLSGEAIGGSYTLKISPKEPNEKGNSSLPLMDILTTTPYLDWKHRPKINLLGDDTHSMNVKIMVREDGHLEDLVRLIEERGYLCKVK